MNLKIIKMKNKMLLISILFLFISFNKKEYKEIHFVINDNEYVEIIIPVDFKDLKFNDEESFGIIFGWQTGEIIQLSKGPLNKYTINEADSVLCKYEDDFKIVIKGVNLEDNYYWRYDQYKSINDLTISYLNVTISNLFIFNSLLDNVKIKKVSQ